MWKCRYSIFVTKMEWTLQMKLSFRKLSMNGEVPTLPGSMATYSLLSFSHYHPVSIHIYFHKRFFDVLCKYSIAFLYPLNTEWCISKLCPDPLWQTYPLTAFLTYLIFFYCEVVTAIETAILDVLSYWIYYLWYHFNYLYCISFNKGFLEHIVPTRNLKWEFHCTYF